MKVLTAILLFVVPVFAAWPRYVVGQNGSHVDYPESHPLAAFTEFPWRTFNGDICYPCSPQEVAWAKSQKARTELRPLGTANGFPVFDFFYYWHGELKPGFKSILVRTGPDTYREIYHDEPNEGQPNPSFLVKAGKDPLMCVADNIYKWDAEEDCFWFGADGVVRLDFTPVWTAAQKAVPAGRRIWEYGIKPKTSFATMRLPVGIRYESNSHCCDRGVVEVRFRLSRGRISVIAARFDPDAEYEW